MSGIENWHDYYSKTLGGNGFNFALNNEITRKYVPPGIIFKYDNGKNMYASLGNIDNPNVSRDIHAPAPDRNTNIVRVSFYLNLPPSGNNSADLLPEFTGLENKIATLTLSSSRTTENSTVIAKGAYSFVTEPIDIVQVVPLDLALAAKLGSVIMFPKSRDMYMILGLAPELPEGKAMVMRLTKRESDEELKGGNTPFNPFLETIPYGQTIALVGETKLHYWISNK